MIRSHLLIKAYPYGLLAVLVSLGIAMGVWQEIITPTLPNLKEKLQVSYESLGQLMSLRALGNIMALLVTGYLFDTYTTYVPYMMAGLCSLAGTVTIIIPWCQRFWVVALLFFIQSGCQNAMNNGGQLLVLKTFKDKAVGKMQIYHLGYGIGGVLSGFISQPFLPRHVSHKAKITKYCFAKLEIKNLNVTNQTNVFNNGSQYNMSPEISFEYIYLIAGLIALTSSLIFLCFVSLKNPMKSKDEPVKKESWIKKINPKYIANNRTSVGILMMVLLFTYYFFYVFGLLNFLPYIVVYAIDPCKSYYMDQKTAAYLHSAVGASFLLGRIFGSLILDLQPTLVLLLLNSFNIVSVSILLFFSHKYAVALWIGACCMRFCNSVVYPSGTSYVNRYIIVTSSLISLAFLGSTSGVFGQLLGGYIIDHYPSVYMFYACLISMILLWFNILLFVLIGKKIGKRTFLEEKSSLKISTIDLTKS